MDGFGNSVRKQTLTVECDSEESALALRGRIGDVNTARFLPIIERVLGEADVAGRHFQIERLDVDLGDIDLHGFEAVAAERLYLELKQAVERAVSSPFECIEKPESLSRLEFLEWYLVRGSLPFSGVPAEAFSLESWFADLAQREPEALARLVRETGARDQVLQRIVYQLSWAELRRLVAVLDPEHAAVIVAYMLDLKIVHHEAPLGATDEVEFDRLLWLLVLTYLVREVGSQFNRKVFVESLIQGFAARMGIEYESALAMLGRGLERTLMRRGLPSSLPAVIAELLSEAGLEGGAAKVSDVEPTDPVALARLVRRYGSDPAWLERLVSGLDEAALIALLEFLAPEQAAQILAFLFDVRDIHRAEPVVRTEGARFDRLLWLIALAWVVRESGSQFNRKAFLRALVERVAAREGLEFTDVLATFQRGLLKLAGRAPLRSSLPAILAALLEDMGLADIDRHEEAPEVTEEEARRLLLRVFPALERAGSPFAEALKQAVEGLEDPRGVYGLMIAAAARGAPLDFEEIREAAAVSLSLGAAIAIRLSSETASDVSPLFAEWKRADAGEARTFLRGLVEHSVLREALLRSFDTRGFNIVLDVAVGSDASDLRGLMRAIAELPASDRPSLGPVREILLHETLQWDAGTARDGRFFSRVMAAAFPVPLPERIRRALAAALRAYGPGDAANQTQVAGVEPITPLSAEEILVRIIAADENEAAADEMLVRQLDERLEDRTDASYREVKALVADRRSRARLLRVLPAATRLRLLRFLEPVRWRTLREAAGIFAAAWAKAAPESRKVAIREALEAALLDLAVEDSPSWERLSARVFARFTEANPDNAKAEAAFRREAEALAEKAGTQALRKVLEAKASVPGPRPAGVAAKKSPALSEQSRRIYLNNAGLVLTSPFLPHLFTSLEMFQKDEKGRNKWRDREAAARAVHLLQYLVDARTSAAEPLLVLNKIVCGLPTGNPIPRFIDATDHEKQMCEKLLQAMIANWQSMSGSSVAALRETFLVREGALDHEGGKWKLHVQRKTLDVLVDQVPWGFNPVFHDWMPQPVYVTW